MRCLLLLLFMTAAMSLSLKAQDSEHNPAEDSLRIVIASTNSIEEKASAYVDLAESLKFVNTDSCYHYANKALSLIDRDELPGIFADAKRLLAGVYFFRGDYHGAIREAQEGQIQVEGLEEHALLETNLIRILGNGYGALGQYEISLQYFLNALQKFEELEDELGIFASLNNVGVIYLKLGNFEEALDIFERLDANHDPNDVNQVTIPVNLGFIHYELGNFEEAEFHLNRALNYAGNVDKRAYGLSNFKLGQIHLAQKDYSEAIAAFNQSIAIYEEFRNELEEVQSLNGLAQVYLELGNTSKAKEYASRAFDIADRNNGLPEKRNSLETLYIISRQSGDFEDAISYFEQFKTVSDSLQNSEINSEIGRLTAEYEFQQQQNELLLEQRERQLKSEAQLNRQKIVLVSVFVFLIMALATIFALYNNSKQRKRNNQILSQKNEEIEDQAERLRQSNDVKNRLFSIIAHDLRGPLSSLHGLISIIEMNVTSKEDLDKMIPQLAEQFKNTSTLLHNLLQWSQSQMKGYKVIPETFDINALILQKKELLNIKLKEKNLNFTMPDGKYFIKADRNMIDLVVQNLISNAIKYCEKGGNIEVDITGKGEEAVIMVKDSGVGIPEHKMEEIFSENFYTTKGTSDETGTGLGLMLCKDFVHRNHGEIWVESKVGEGSIFFFTLPHPEKLYA
jgi:signal transduction histidine kinase